MANDETFPEKERLHTRQIVVEVFRLPDRRWEIRGQLTDVRDYDSKLKTGLMRYAGTPLHKMEVMLIVDETMTIVAANSLTSASPYPGICENINPAYEKLVGLTIKGGFKNNLKELFGGLKGCTHITELVGSMAVTAVQAISPELEKHSDKRPRKLDSCHALDTNKEVVKNYYPGWYGER